MLDVRSGALVIEADERGYDLSDAQDHLDKINYWLGANVVMNKIIIIDFSSITTIEGQETLNLLVRRGKTLSTQRNGGKILFVVPSDNRSLKIQLGNTITYPSLEHALKKATLR